MNPGRELRVTPYISSSFDPVATHIGLEYCIDKLIFIIKNQFTGFKKHIKCETPRRWLSIVGVSEGDIITKDILRL